MPVVSWWTTWWLDHSNLLAPDAGGAACDVLIADLPSCLDWLTIPAYAALFDRPRDALSTKLLAAVVRPDDEDRRT